MKINLKFLPKKLNKLNKMLMKKKLNQSNKTLWQKKLLKWRKSFLNRFYRNNCKQKFWFKMKWRKLKRKKISFWKCGKKKVKKKSKKKFKNKKKSKNKMMWLFKKSLYNLKKFWYKNNKLINKNKFKKE